MPSDGALVVRALGYWAGWLYFARRFGWPPPDDKSKSKAAGGGKKQPDKGTKAPAPAKEAPKAAVPAKDAPKAAAPAKAVPAKAAPSKAADSKGDGNKKTADTGGDVPPKATPAPVEPVGKQAESTASATAPTTSFWSLFDSPGTAKSTSKDWPKETGLHEWKGEGANGGSADKTPPSK